MNNLSDIIEDIKKLNIDELQELNFVTGKYIAEIERDNIINSHIKSIEEFKSNKLKFSSDIDELKNQLDIL